MPATAIFICFRASCFLSLQFDLPVFHIPVLFSLKQLQLLSFSTVYRNHSSAILILYSKSELVTTAIFITTAIAFCRTLPNNIHLNRVRDFVRFMYPFLHEPDSTSHLLFKALAAFYFTGNYQPWRRQQRYYHSGRSFYI